MGSFKQKWIDEYEAIKASYSREYGKEGWQQGSLARGPDYVLFEYGLVTLCASVNEELAKQYLEAAISAAQSELSYHEECIAKKPDHEPVHRGMQAERLRVLSYAQFLLGGLLDIRALCRAAMYINMSAKYSPRGYLQLESEDRLTALQAALICGDSKLARLLLKDARQTVRKYPGFRLNMELCDLLESDLPPDPSLRLRFTEYFSQARDPKYRNIHIPAKFERVCLYDKYFVSTDRQLDKNRLITALTDDTLESYNFNK